MYFLDNGITDYAVYKSKGLPEYNKMVIWSSCLRTEDRFVDTRAMVMFDVSLTFIRLFFAFAVVVAYLRKSVKRM